MYLRTFSTFLALSVSSAFCQSLPDISGAWNGAVCKGMGDMLVSAARSLLPLRVLSILNSLQPIAILQMSAMT
jgi:hypothetical protein